MPPRPQPATPPPDEPAVIELDARSFNSAERLEVQTHFDVDFADALTYIYEMINPNRSGAMPFALVDREGNRHFGDQLLQFMVWIQAKRTNPAAKIEDYDDLDLRAFTRAYVRGLSGKAGSGNTK